MKKGKPVIVVGAGLCGTLLALRLAQHGMEVRLIEQRSDMRKQILEGGRSINLALSSRGLMALDRVGLLDEIEPICIPMQGRMIHPAGEQAFLSRYSARENEYINSISRSSLNTVLLDHAEAHDNIQISFNEGCASVDLREARVHIKNKVTGTVQSIEGVAVFGTDGAGSVVRQSLMKDTRNLLFNYSQHFLRHGYKELSIPPGTDGVFSIEKHALHIWPRGNFMTIALPNLDASFTVTMFHPFDGLGGFNTLDNATKVQSFFEEYYPDLIPHMPEYIEEYFNNPTGILGTIKCYPWQAYDKVCLMGDAAHAVVPFYGQGMNASFEDVRVFDDIFKQEGDNWALVFSRFQDERVTETNAIADLAIDNFTEMRDRVDDGDFIKKRQLEMKLESTYADYYSKYSLVTFKPDMPYSKAMHLGRKQDEVLLELCRENKTKEMSLESIYQTLMSLQA